MKEFVQVFGVLLMASAPVMWLLVLWDYAVSGIAESTGEAAGLAGVILLICGICCITAADGMDR